MKLTTHLHLVLKSKNAWSYISALQYAFMAWRSVKKETAQGQLYLYLLLNVIGVIKSRRMKWAEHVACMGKISATKFWSEHLKRRNHSKDLDVDGRIILE
jgi:hypothetical protein